ncbi:MAG TPA: DUF4430 domain-containing protein [Candidatus Saccharimonadales bacterium]|nr:DUF4430 domain-containing protein [Candidatus Saccharimonadales bacterium]
MLKKYLLPIVLVSAVAGLFFLTKSSDSSSTPKVQTAITKTEQTSKVESLESTGQTPNPQTSQTENKIQAKVQGSSTNQKANSSTSQPASSTTEAGMPIKEVSLKIEAGTKGTYIYKIPWESGDSVWTVLERGGQLNHFPIEHDDQSYKPRIYVTDIYDTNCECWTFKVNNICSNVAANSYSVSENDSILWSINKMCS